MSPKADELHWYVRYPLGIALIAFGIYIGNQPRYSGWLVAAIAIAGVLMMYEALLLMIFAAVCFYFFRALSAVPSPWARSSGFGSYSTRTRTSGTSERRRVFRASDCRVRSEI
ncbi:hypothetical protein [Variovorax sp. PBL-E5]|uniref:hypothetical protein n=1 Tax=Variovorax sp. PBL-E5 TaxID=434014 RepID=UPI0013A57F63|nr:hypothetical protein [Variovorax sp. PBL-E5]